MRLKNYCRITLVMLMTMLPLFAWSNTINSADVNEDGKVSISDVTALIDFLLTDDASSIDYWAADVDGSGTVNIADVTELVNILLYGQTIPATRTFTANGVTFMMVYVEPGTFMMGSNDSDASDSAKPAHEVTLTRGFYICQTEVTWALWEAVMGVNPNSHVDSLMNHPKTMVYKSDATSFCWELEKILKIYGQISLPTEAEWEYAARGGQKSLGYKYAGSDNPDEVAWYNQGGAIDGRTFPVGLKKPNELGLYDMSGNVNEWCLDHVRLADGYPSEPQTDPNVWENYGMNLVRGGTTAEMNPSSCRVYARVCERVTTWVTGFRFIIHVD